MSSTPIFVGLDKTRMLSREVGIFVPELGRFHRGIGMPNSALIEASDLLRLISEPRPVGDSVKAAINRAARKVSRFLDQPMSAGRAEDIWRREARLIRAEEMDALRAAAEQERSFRHEASDIEARLARLEAVLLAIDPDFHVEMAAALRSGRNAARRCAGPVTGGQP